MVKDKPKKKLGRPKTTEPREAVLFVRITDEDHERFKRASEIVFRNLGLNEEGQISNWARMMLRASAAKILGEE